MRKTTILLLIVGTALFSTSVEAQITNPYLDSTSTWYEMFGGAAPPAYTYLDYNKYYIEGDTIISANNYFKLYWDQIDSTWDYFTGNFLAVNYYAHVYKGGLREDSLKRFYFFYPSQTSESLLFDFNFSVGDSLPNMIANYGCNNPPMTVTNIDTIYLGTQALKKFNLPPGIVNKTLYEGIGSSGGIIWSGTLCQFIETGGCLIAYKKGLDSLYINCGLGATGISETNNKNFINIFPNPAQNKFTVTAGEFILNKIILRNMYGNIVYEQVILSDNYTINSESFPSGIYFLQSESKGNVFFSKVLVEH